MINFDFFKIFFDFEILFRELQLIFIIIFNEIFYSFSI
jgi:hypothetical protein